MRTLILTLLITLSSPVLANSEPIGLFQVDSSLSKITLLDEGQKMSGFIDIRKVFEDSRIKLESSDISFESTEVSGALSDFEVKGYLTYNHETRIVSLKGKYFGMVDLERGTQKIAMTLSSDPVTLRIFAAKPAEATTALHKEVQDIIQ